MRKADNLELMRMIVGIAAGTGCNTSRFSSGGAEEQDTLGDVKQYDRWDVTYKYNTTLMQRVCTSTPKFRIFFS